MTKPIDEVNNEFVATEHKEQPMSITTNGQTVPLSNLSKEQHDKMSVEMEVNAAPSGASDSKQSDKDKSEEDKSIHHPLSYVPWGITSFEELDAFEVAREKSFEISEKAALFPDMIANIMASEDIKDKQKAIRKAGEEFADMVKNMHEDDDKKEIADEKGNMVEENTLNDFVQTEKLTNNSFIVRIKNKVSNALKKKEPDLPSNKLMIWKEKDGTYRWVAVYSNNYRDEDNPPEIISEKSHLNFVEKVRSGEYPYPTLRHYHIPGTDWGQANFVDYQKDTGFALAAGYVLPGHEKEAELIQSMDEDIALSHGMKEVEKDPDDSSIIIQHRTFEISDLPRDVAANKLTNFYMVEKEKSIMLNTETKEYLGNLGFSDNRLSELEKELDKSQKDAEAEGIERKDSKQEDADSKDAGVENVLKGREQTDDAEPAFSEAQSAELKTVFETVIKKQNEQLITLVTPLIESIKKLEEAEGSEQERLKTIVEQSPPLSLEALLFGSQGLGGQSATKSLDTIIDGGARTKEGKDGPKENKEKDEKTILNTGDDFKDQLVNNLFVEEEFEGVN